MKKLLNYLPFHFLFCLIVGILLQFKFSVWKYSTEYLALFLFGFLLILAIFKFFKKKLLFTFTTLLSFVFLGIATVYFQDLQNRENHYTHFIDTSSVAVLTVDKVLKPGNYYHKYKARVSQIKDHKTVGTILLNIQKDSLQNLLKVDDKILLKPVFKNLISPLNPHQFSYKEYLAKQGIHHQIFIANQQYKNVGKRAFSLLGLSAKVRRNIQESLKKYHFKNDEYAVINALLLGQRQDISKELLQDYSRAGAIHILAVSGLHIGVILWILLWLFKGLEKLPRGVLIKTICIVLLLWMFAFIAGLSASVVRAVTMFSFVAVGQSFKRKKVTEHSLIASMFLLLLVKPMFLFDVGFQLSYLAVFGIIWVQPILYNLWKPRFKYLDKGWQIVTVSIAAQAGILPLTLYYFHQFPSLFILSNLLIIPALGAILIGGISIIILSLLNLLPQFLADSYGFIISLMNRFVSWISHQEDFLFTNISMSFWLMLVWYFFIISGFVFFIKKRLKNLIFWLISIVFIQFMYVFENYQLSKKQEFIVFHKSRKSVIGVRNGNYFKVFTTLDSVQIENEKLLLSYSIGERVQPVVSNNIPNYFRFKEIPILVIDSLGVYKINLLKSPIVVLQNSPKINLERLITTLEPREIIADGSNYKSYITRWEESCRQQKTPFYYTGQNGAYILRD